jgi:hypothetical protein
VVIDTGTTSAAGGQADSVLGCETDAGEITLIQGWDWFTASDPTQIGNGQYDFQTIVTHELGHALGLGHSADPASVMYASLDAGTVKRTLLVADLITPDSDQGSCALHAAARGQAAAAENLPALPSAALGLPSAAPAAVSTSPEQRVGLPPEIAATAWTVANTLSRRRHASGAHRLAKGTRPPASLPAGDNAELSLDSSTPRRLLGVHTVRDYLFAAFAGDLVEARPLLDWSLLTA